LKKYRRIEVNAFRRRVTIISAVWPSHSLEGTSTKTADEVPLDDAAVCEPIQPESLEGQLILVEAVRSLERRLSPETLATMRNASPAAHTEVDKLNSYENED
jgi:hypothetical protein